MLVDELGEGAADLHQLLVGSLSVDPAVLHNHDPVHVGQEADAVSGQDSGLVLQQPGL